jgi:hypothetical protein
MSLRVGEEVQVLPREVTERALLTGWFGSDVVLTGGSIARALADVLDKRDHAPAGTYLARLDSVGSPGPGAEGMGRWDGEHLLLFGPDQPPGALVDHPVMAVAQEHQVVEVGVPTMPPSGGGDAHWSRTRVARTPARRNPGRGPATPPDLHSRAPAWPGRPRAPRHPGRAGPGGCSHHRRAAAPSPPAPPRRTPARPRARHVAPARSPPTR